MIKAGGGLYCSVSPAGFLAQFAKDAGPAAAVETIRWYGVLLWVPALSFPFVSMIGMGVFLSVVRAAWLAADAKTKTRDKAKTAKAGMSKLKY